MLKMKITDPAETKWAAWIVLNPKEDGSPCFCVEFRKLNAITTRDSYPIARMDECLDSLRKGPIFYTLRADCGFWRIEINDDDCDKTYFTSHHWLLRFSRMHFGLPHETGTFQRKMDGILSPIKCQFALMYLKGIIIFSCNANDHKSHVCIVLSLLCKAAFTLNLKKGKLFTEKIDYLRHVIRLQRLEPADHTTDTVCDLKLPTA